MSFPFVSGHLFSCLVLPWQDTQGLAPLPKPPGRGQSGPSSARSLGDVGTSLAAFLGNVGLYHRQGAAAVPRLSEVETQSLELRQATLSLGPPGRLKKRKEIK